MELLMNGIPFNSLEFFIWSSISCGSHCRSRAWGAKTSNQPRYLEVFVYPVNQTVHRIIQFFIAMNRFQWNNALREMSHKTRMWIIHHNSKWFIQILPNLARSLPRLKTNPVNVEAREENSNQLLQVRKIQKLKKKNQKVKAWVRYHNE